MRSNTLIRAVRIASIVAGLAVLPQLASAQLPIETKQLKLQNTGGTQSVTLSAPAASESYSLTFPATGSPGKGAFLFMTNTDGQYKWTNAPTAQQTTIYFDGTDVTWVDPTGASNPNWALTGNNKASGDYTLGFTDNASTATIAIKTGNNTRIAIASDGVITIDETTNINAVTNINVTGGATTNIASTSGAAAVNIGNEDASITMVGATNINNTGNDLTNIGTSATAGTVTIGRTSGTLTTIGTLGHTGAATITGATTVVGTTNVNATGTDATNIGTSSTAGTVTIGRTSGTLTTIGTLGHTGAANITGATTVVGTTSINATGTDATTIGASGGSTAVTGTTTLNGSVALGTSTATPLLMNADAGTSGEVLVSKGSNATPEWQNLNESIGIRAAGVKTISSGNTVTVSTIVLQATDAIIITLGGSTSVVATITSRTNSANESTADGSFTVTFSGTYAGSLNYVVMKQSTPGS